MHATLDELLEHSQHGLLWVGQDGTIRHINSQGGQRTGLALGRKLFDPDLKRALVEVITSRTPKVVKAIGAAPRPGAAPAELNCRVLPGLAKDDAFVVVQAEGADSGGVAFDNLMQVIRTDLRDPLRQAQQALAGALRTGVANDMKVAGEHVDSLIKLVEKLVDLAAVWRSDALMSADRIELWPLLQQCWAEVEPLAQQRSVTARLQVEGELKDLAVLYGSEQWLKRVFTECLEMAVRGVPAGGALEIEHRQMGARAIIMLRDVGVFSQEEVKGVALTGGAPAQAAGTETPKRPVGEAIGLQLAEHIISLHGGQLREEDEGGLHTFVIDLPTGAPHQFDSSQLDIAQAQQYAKDLAALMARARDRKAQANKPA
ncbi:HAMP domain-containing histidine kinase [Ideonella paludis]|uniref:histidine kinase n=1 Tax=Ideonella paludis TaxID=1233411 RepID=A0ABS5DS64_9BURK|nr:HAMP domain-containing histidine kinase [Ideonella paludis]MBQ0933993.1 HAMP domain-containing histidine kinase [Ideonella paludis]